MPHARGYRKRPRNNRDKREPCLTPLCKDAGVKQSPSLRSEVLYELVLPVFKNAASVGVLWLHLPRSPPKGREGNKSTDGDNYGTLWTVAIQQKW